MPKRPFPFGDASALQLKTHVGTKELAMGSRQEELMRDVYGKLLFPISWLSVISRIYRGELLSEKNTCCLSNKFS
jgi:hypothetical protein